MNAMVRYQMQAWSTRADAMTNDAPTPIDRGQMAKKMAPNARRTSITTQMLVVMARMRDAMP